MGQLNARVALGGGALALSRAPRTTHTHTHNTHARTRNKHTTTNRACAHPHANTHTARAQKSNSKYGNEHEAIAVYHMMRGVEKFCPIYTLCVGNAFGEAALLLSAGSKGKRASLRSSTIMMRQPLQRLAGMQASDIDIYRGVTREKTALMVRVWGLFFGGVLFVSGGSCCCCCCCLCVCVCVCTPTRHSDTLTRAHKHNTPPPTPLTHTHHY